MAILIGRELNKKILEDLKEQIQGEKRAPGLAVIQIGNDPASNVYVGQKEKMAKTLGFKFIHIKLDESIEESEVLSVIEKLNQDESIDGILIQMPIPKHLNAKKILNTLKPQKDVDGLTDINMEKLVRNEEGLVPCTPMGIIDLLKYYNIEITGKNVVIIGRSNLVGKPLFNLMINNNATVTLTHSKTKNLKEITKNADILVVAIGKPNFITSDYIKEGAVVIDVGINRVDGKLYGDVNFKDVQEKASYITPVPGGVGPMTIAELGKNVWKAYKGE